MKVFDCFMLFNELDLLEIRLHELDGCVDWFVVVEAAETFAGEPKRLVYDREDPRWRGFGSRIVHVVVDDPPKHAGPWGREHFQRNAILRGLAGPLSHPGRPFVDPMDLILVSDIDEIPRGESVAFVNDRLVRGIAAFVQRWSYYHVNQRAYAPPPAGSGAPGDGEPEWYDKVQGTKAVRFAELTTPMALRELREAHVDRFAMVVPNGGWHFSFCGGVERIQDKVQAYAHQELNTSDVLDTDRLLACVRDGIDLFDRHHEMRFMTVPIDDSFPAFLRDNQHRFRHLVKPIDDNGNQAADEASLLLLRLSNEMRRCADLVNGHDTADDDRREAVRVLRRLRSVLDGRT